MGENMNRPAGDPILSAKEALAQALAAAEAALNRAEKVRGGASAPTAPVQPQPVQPAPAQQAYAQRTAAPTAPVQPQAAQPATAQQAYAQRTAAPTAPVQPQAAQPATAQQAYAQRTAAPAVPVQPQAAQPAPAQQAYAQRTAAPMPNMPVQRQPAPIQYAQRPAAPAPAATVQRQPVPIQYAQRPAEQSQQAAAQNAPVQRKAAPIQYAERPAAPPQQTAQSSPAAQRTAQRPAGPNPLLARYNAPARQQTASETSVQRQTAQHPATPNPLLSRNTVSGVPTADMIAQVYQVPEKKQETLPEPEPVQETAAVPAAAPVTAPVPSPAAEIAPAPEPEPLPEPARQTAPAPAVTAPLQTETTAQTVSRKPWDPDTTETTAALHMKEQEEEPYTAKDFINDALDLVGSVLISVFAVMLIFTYLFRAADVEGDSMVPTLQDGNKLLLTRIGRSYETGDILILNSRTSYTFGKSGELIQGNGLGKQIVKRLIAQGGQEVNINFTQGVVYVDGQPLDEPYVNTATNRDEGGFTYPFTVPEGYVFVMGDNRNISLDSRSGSVGLIPVDDISGRVIWRILPLSSFGGVD